MGGTQDWMGILPTPDWMGVSHTSRTGWGTPPYSTGRDTFPPSRTVPPCQDWLGTPLSRTGWVPPIQGLDRLPPRHPGQDEFLPWPGLDGVTPPARTGLGTPLSRTRWGTLTRTGCDTTPSPPETEQHSEHLLHDGRYAPCVHAGGFSFSSVK